MTQPHTTAIVAGAGSDLGIALCRQLAAADYRVVGLARGNAAREALLDSLYFTPS